VEGNELRVSESGKADWCGGCDNETKYISYPEVNETNATGAVLSYKPESLTPSPPWTTWSGVIQCDKNSRIGKMLQKMDPNVQIAFVKKTRHGKLIEIEDHIRGLWTFKFAPSEFCLK
jgi:hypothetical protein